MALSLLENKTGLEIGGPSQLFGWRHSLLPVYRHIRSLDNCDISSKTTWTTHSNAFSFDPEKTPGKNIFCDGSDLGVVRDRSYDFVLSCHNLEHFANPVKAIKEWQRVTVDNGLLILVLPHYRYMFDHRRQPTPVGHMLADFEQNTPETDLSHLEEILKLHDLSRDPAAGSWEQFRERSQVNFENRCLHHHVFEEQNTYELLTTLGMEVLSIETVWPIHIFVVAKMP
jgi:SAM-dependent methyltransferase